MWNLCVYSWQMDGVETRAGNWMWFRERVEGKNMSAGPKDTDVWDRSDKDDEWFHLRIQQIWEKLFSEVLLSDSFSY